MNRYGIIYKCINLINGKIYIGKTIKDLNRRIYEHNSIQRKGKKSYLKNSIHKYGKENFLWGIIDKFPLDILNEMEIFYINKYKSNIIGIGYNLTIGGDGASPGELNPAKRNDVREKLRKNSTGFKHSDETKNKLRIKALEQFKNGMPIETKSKISESLKGHFANKGENSKLSKYYEFISPNGELFSFKGIRQFCRENKLCHSSMVKVSKGIKPSYKGWKIKK